MIIIFREVILTLHRFGAVFLLVFIIFSLDFSHVYASEKDNEALIKYIDQTIESLRQSNWDEVNKSFREGKKIWNQQEDEIRNKSFNVHAQLKQDFASATLAILQEDAGKAEESLQRWKSTLIQYQAGDLNLETGRSSSKINLASYLERITELIDSLEAKDYAKAKVQMEALTNQWLMVEGEVVGRSSEVYQMAEKNLVVLQATIQDPNKTEQNIQLLEELHLQLKPLANQSYTVWDAALIPIREGLEALLVIGALLSLLKRKEETKKGGKWVWLGTFAGVIVSLSLGLLLTSILNAASMGANNFLINGLSGVLASVMLLYVSYWLHEKSNIARWNTYLQEKTESALAKGSLFTFALIAFFAVLREGLETVIFFLGMANQMPASTLWLGFGGGIGVLIVVGFLLLRLSAHIPLRPFFLVSSLIVFYLCFKFLGSGIHSLQLAGIIPSTSNEQIPAVDWLGLYPSWYSTIPQLIFVILFVGLWFTNRFKSHQKPHQEVM